MSKPKKRDNAYWLGRLEREHPAIFDRLRSGAIPSVRAACAEAGLIRLPSRLDALKREWARASSSERAAFVAWVKGMLPPRPTVVSLPVVLTGPDGTLLPEVIDRIKAIMARPGPFGPGRAPHGRIMSAMGYARSSTRLANALDRRGKPDGDFLDRLRAWMVAAEGA